MKIGFPLRSCLATWLASFIGDGLITLLKVKDLFYPLWWVSKLYQSIVPAIHIHLQCHAAIGDWFKPINIARVDTHHWTVTGARHWPDRIWKSVMAWLSYDNDSTKITSNMDYKFPSTWGLIMGKDGEKCKFFVGFMSSVIERTDHKKVLFH